MLSQQNELALLRRQEQFTDVGNRIGDLVAYPLQMAPEINDAVRASAINAAVEKFRVALPPGVIAAIVDKQIEAEIETRQRSAALRRQKVAKRRRLL